MSENFYLFSVAAAIANLGCLIQIIGKDHTFQRLMAAFYLIVGIFNLSTGLMFQSETVDGMVFWWTYFMTPTWFAVPALMVALSAFASGRKILGFPLILNVVIAFSIYLSIIIYPDFYIQGSTTVAFANYTPLISLPGNLLRALPQFIGIGFCTYYLARPIRWENFFSKGILTLAMLLWWLPIFTYLFANTVLKLPPFHAFADTIMSVMLTVYFNRKSIGIYFPLNILSNVLISMAVGVSVGLLMLQSFVQIQNGRFFLISFASLITTSILSYLLNRISGLNHVAPASLTIALKKFGLSRQELRICELIQEGHSRSFIQMVLNVSNGTLRNYLKSIYAKVLPSIDSGEIRKDQLQRLTIFLNKLKSGYKNGETFLGQAAVR